MVEDIHIASILRATKKTVIKPQSTTVCFAKHKDHANLQNKIVEVNALDKGFICEKPGLMIGNVVAKTKSPRRIPVLMVNNTNKTFKLKRGCVIGRVNVIDDQSIETSIQDKNKEKVENLNTELLVSPEHRQMIEKLVMRNQDIFTKSDADLGHTDTIKMKIDTGDHPPIKMKPYRTPLNKRKIVDKAIDEMLSANIV
jgi:hypothetical protein